MNATPTILRDTAPRVNRSISIRLLGERSEPEWHGLSR
jgi:hypothetical protein